MQWKMIHQKVQSYIPELLNSLVSLAELLIAGLIPVNWLLALITQFLYKVIKMKPMEPMLKVEAI